MKSLNLLDVVKQVNPNEKLLLEELGSINIYLCKCKGVYAPEYFYKQRLIYILEGKIEFVINGKHHISKQGDLIKIDHNENIEIVNSNARLLTIIEDKQ